LLRGGHTPPPPTHTQSRLSITVITVATVITVVTVVTVVTEREREREREEGRATVEKDSIPSMYL
jgi:hypothetical protein